MANVTLAIDDDLLKRGREYAHKHNTSFNALIRKLLREAVARQERQAQLQEVFALMDQADGHSGGEKWPRRELYDA